LGADHRLIAGVHSPGCHGRALTIDLTSAIVHGREGIGNRCGCSVACVGNRITTAVEFRSRR
ncbi:hypothetical protein, partial [Paraburkholderia piptadeniae]|uniref:hypothetical protein n=1 Tax=Paraburkholderia piptadeniae TaxID=1701573 RepID=UPI001C44C8DC